MIIMEEGRFRGDILFVRADFKHRGEFVAWFDRAQRPRWELGSWIVGIGLDFRFAADCGRCWG